MGDVAVDPLWQSLRSSLRALVGRHITRIAPGVKIPVPLAAVALVVTVPTGGQAEPDTSYGVHATPSWNTSVWLTGRTVTQFTLNFGAAAPANATVDYTVFRR